MHLNMRCYTRHVSAHIFCISQMFMSSSCRVQILFGILYDGLCGSIVEIIKYVDLHVYYVVIAGTGHFVAHV